MKLKFTLFSLNRLYFFDKTYTAGKKTDQELIQEYESYWKIHQRLDFPPLTRPTRPGRAEDYLNAQVPLDDPEDYEIDESDLSDPEPGWFTRALSALDDISNATIPMGGGAGKISVWGLTKGARIALVTRVLKHGRPLKFSLDVLRAEGQIGQGLRRVIRASEHPIAAFAQGGRFHLKRIDAIGLDNIDYIEVTGAKGAYRFDIILKNGTLVEVKSWSDNTLRYKLRGKLRDQLEGYLSQGKPVRLEFEGRMDPGLIDRVKRDFPMVEVVDEL